MVQTLSLYWHQEAWCFDDEEKGVKAEPFVMGSSELITALADENDLNSGEKKNLTLRFSDTFFEGAQMRLDWVRYQEKKWNLYESKAFDMEGWLCPVLYKYFDLPPERLFVQVE